MCPLTQRAPQYLDKRLFIQLNGSRKILGVLRGYDVFLNIVLDDAVEEKAGGEKVRLGMCVVRGNSVVMLEVSAVALFASLHASYSDTGGDIGG